MTTAKTKELTITRILHVPRERVWHAWTNADTMKQWGGRSTSPARKSGSTSASGAKSSWP
jgi:uncharacterized protein YndB with AHSA1/START domain